MKSQYQKFDSLVSKLLDGSVSKSEFTLNLTICLFPAQIYNTDIAPSFAMSLFFIGRMNLQLAMMSLKSSISPFFPMLQVSQLFWFVLLVLGSCILNIPKSPFSQINRSRLTKYHIQSQMR